MKRFGLGAGVAPMRTCRMGRPVAAERVVGVCTAG